MAHAIGKNNNNKNKMKKMHEKQVLSLINIKGA